MKCKCELLVCMCLCGVVISLIIKGPWKSPHINITMSIFFLKTLKYILIWCIHRKPQIRKARESRKKMQQLTICFYLQYLQQWNLISKWTQNKSTKLIINSNEETLSRNKTNKKNLKRTITSLFFNITQNRKKLWSKEMAVHLYAFVALENQLHNNSPNT